MSNDKATNRTRVFVYGTLKQGHGNHEYYLAERPSVVYLGRATIVGDYRMYSNGAFPMVTAGFDPNTSLPIHGEVYEIDEETLLALDVLEGHPEWYKRHKVETVHGKAWVYLMPDNPRFTRENMVESGSFHPSPEEEEYIRNGSEG